MRIKQDYANLDGKKVAKIMAASGNIYYQHPKGVIKTGQESQK